MVGGEISTIVWSNYLKHVAQIIHHNFHLLWKIEWVSKIFIRTLKLKKFSTTTENWSYKNFFDFWKNRVAIIG
jgi:hypothetical protein